MDYITACISPIDWTEGDVYGMSFELEGESPTMRIDWGDGTSSWFSGNEVSAYHIYPKDETLSFMVIATATSGTIVHVMPCGGDCRYESVDLTHAPSLRSAYIECFAEVKLNNMLIEEMTMRLLCGSHYDLSSCVNLRELKFDCGSNLKSLDLSMCHKLEKLVCWGYRSRLFSRIEIPNDAPLRHLDIRGHHFCPQCLDTLRRIVHRNNGEIIEHGIVFKM